MKKNACLLYGFCFLISVSFAQDVSLFEKKWMVQNGDTLPYRILMPVNYSPDKTYPVIFFLHGAGERGRDNEKQLTHGARLFLDENNRKNYEAIVIFPQCPATDYWSNVLRTHDDKGKKKFTFLKDGPPGRYMILLTELVDYILQEYPVKFDQIYAGGLSMGGMGTFELVRRKPNLFAAAFPICGGGNTETAATISKTNWWIFHGAKDDVVPYFHSENMALALEKHKAKVQFTLYPNANHNSWDPALAEPQLLQWLFSIKK